MDLRTKLVFAVVAVSLGSMIALGLVTYKAARDQLRDKTLRQLDGLAESKKEDLEKVIVGWEDRIRLIASRTQLRRSLHQYNQTRSAESRAQIGRILADARRAVRTVERMETFDLEGGLVASAGRASESGPTELAADRLPVPPKTVVYEGVIFVATDTPRVSYIASLMLEGERVGALRVLLRAEELVDLTGNFTGLDQTGETMIVLRDRAGPARVLHPVRHRDTERPGFVSPEGPTDPATRALGGEEGIFWKGVIDYRGQPVWAATRYLPEVRWGLVVKFDEAEELAPMVELRRAMTRLALSLSAFAILLGTFLGLRFAKPIHDLAEVADRIGDGELSARAGTQREDELGLLARTLNQMAGDLQEQMSLLREFQKFFDVSLDMLCIAGTDGYFKRVNPAFERTLGWSTEQLLSQPFIELVHPDDVEATVREIEKLAQGIPTISFENRFRCADGGYRRLLWTSHPDPETGLLYAVARDMTELKEARERLRASGRSDAEDRA